MCGKPRKTATFFDRWVLLSSPRGSIPLASLPASSQCKDLVLAPLGLIPPQQGLLLLTCCQVCSTCDADVDLQAEKIFSSVAVCHRCPASSILGSSIHCSLDCRLSLGLLLSEVQTLVHEKTQLISHSSPWYSAVGSLLLYLTDWMRACCYLQPQPQGPLHIKTWMAVLSLCHS